MRGSHTILYPNGHKSPFDFGTGTKPQPSLTDSNHCLHRQHEHRPAKTYSWKPPCYGPVDQARGEGIFNHLFVAILTDWYAGKFGPILLTLYSLWNTHRAMNEKMTRKWKKVWPVVFPDDFRDLAVQLVPQLDFVNVDCPALANFKPIWYGQHHSPCTKYIHAEDVEVIVGYGVLNHNITPFLQFSIHCVHEIWLRKYRQLLLFSAIGFLAVVCQLSSGFRLKQMNIRLD